MAAPRKKTPVKNLPSHEMSDRTLRTEESREHEQHHISDRAPFNFGALGRFSVHPEIQARFPDHVLGYIAYSRSNEELRENYEDAIDRHWTPVLRSEIAEYNRDAYLSPFEKTANGSDQLIRRGGQILMKRLKIHQEAENKHWNQQHLRQQEMSHLFEGENFKPSYHDVRKTRVRETEIGHRY